MLHIFQSVYYSAQSRSSSVSRKLKERKKVVQFTPDLTDDHHHEDQNDDDACVGEQWKDYRAIQYFQCIVNILVELLEMATVAFYWPAGATPPPPQENDKEKI